MVVHDDTANDYDEYSCQDDQARKDEKHEPAYRKPVGAVEGLVNVDEDQGEQGCIHDEAHNVALFVQVGWDFLVHISAWAVGGPACKSSSFQQDYQPTTLF